MRSIIAYAAEKYAQRKHEKLTKHSNEQGKRRIPEEKGPFGKARKRGASRSKTPTTARGQDQNKVDELRFLDELFGQQKVLEENKAKQSLQGRKASNPSASLPVSASAPNLLEGLGNVSFQGSASTTQQQREPAEVILWGYANDVQWAAIEFYERASSGMIYEEYDRQPPNARYNLSLSHQRGSNLRSLSKAWLRKINEYVGGEHWIKVTFDSAEAAERACHYSPHVIQGYIVTAQRYQGRGPNEDIAVPASAGSALSSLTSSPNAPSSSTLPFGSISSTTLSSATATNSMPSSSLPRHQTVPNLRFRASGAFPLDDDDEEDADRTLIPRQQPQPPARTSTSTSSQLSEKGKPAHSTLRVKNAKPAVLLPPEKAFLPARSRWQQTFGSWPVIGWVIGKNHGIIGDQVPRKEDGSFDSAGASLYWRVWYNVDSCFGTDFCGVRDAEYDD
jgi:hypothetical protein